VYSSRTKKGRRVCTYEEAVVLEMDVINQQQSGVAHNEAKQDHTVEGTVAVAGRPAC